MHLGNLYMAMLLAKISGRHMTVSAAGMPPILIYRNDTGAVEEMLLKGMPLGGPYAFDYPQSETVLHPGDVILFMSDGYPELFNEMMKCWITRGSAKFFGKRLQNRPPKSSTICGKPAKHGRTAIHSVMTQHRW